MNDIAAIIIPIFIIVSIIVSVVKASANAKPSGNNNNSERYSDNNENRPRSVFSDLISEIKAEQQKAEGVHQQDVQRQEQQTSSSFRPKKVESKPREVVNVRERQNLERDRVLSRNKYMSYMDKNNGKISHTPLAEENGLRAVHKTPYKGSLGTKYAGEGCSEHGDIRYMSDNGNVVQNKSILDNNNLSSLQKIIVFGEVINKPVSRRKNRF